jgi:hypothetical protein
VIDRFELLLLKSKVSVAVFGNPAAHEFAVIGLGPGPAPDYSDLLNRDYRFIGVVGICAGGFRSEMAEEVDATSTHEIAEAAVQYLTARAAVQYPAKLQPVESVPRAERPIDDSEAWLWRLWSLPDTRDA